MPGLLPARFGEYALCTSLCLIIVVRGSETHETKVWFWSSRQLSDPRNVCRRLEFSLSSSVRYDSASSRSWSMRRCCLRALFLAVAFRGSVTAFSAANLLIMDSSALCWAEATLNRRKSTLWGVSYQRFLTSSECLNNTRRTPLVLCSLNLVGREAAHLNEGDVVRCKDLWLFHSCSDKFLPGHTVCLATPLIRLGFRYPV